MASIVVESPPAVEPVSPADVKVALGFGPAQDADHAAAELLTHRIRPLIAAARDYCEVFTRRAFINTGYVQMLDSFPYFTDTLMSQQAYPPAYYSLPRYSTTLWNYSQMVKLFYSPLVSVDHITYIESRSGRPRALVTGPAPWFPLATYRVGAKVSDSNGNVQTCTKEGKTAAEEPTWPTVAAETTDDGTATWTADGQPAATSSFVVDSAAEPPRIFPATGQYWPACLYIPNAVRIHFTAGYGPTAASVPNWAKVAITRLVIHWYRTSPDAPAPDAQMVPEDVKRILWSRRVLDAAPTRG